MEGITYSLVIPVYKNEESISRLLDVLRDMNEQIAYGLEVIFVVDGSPDNSFFLLKEALCEVPFYAQLIAHSRNFGSFPAVRTGLAAAKGQFYGVMAADLQEPPELLVEFFHELSLNHCDVTIGVRKARSDPFFSRLSSAIFWGLYRRFIVKEMPEGGVDVFGCNKLFRDHLLAFEESRSSLVALIFWLGFRRKYVPYVRLARQEGKSAWLLRKKIDYMLDSVFAFTDYPIRLLMRIGAIGIFVSIVLAAAALIGRLTGAIDVPGYAATLLTVLFFGTLNLFGLGLVGNYAWRSYENSKRRPLAIVAVRHDNYKERQ